MTLLIAMVGAASTAAQSPSPTTAPAGDGNTVVIKWPEAKPSGPPGAPEKFSARFAPESLIAFLRANQHRLPLPMRPAAEQDAVVAALEAIDMGALIEEIKDDLQKVLGDRLDLKRGLILEPVPAERQVQIDLKDIGLETYRGPTHQATGLLVHGITEEEYVVLALHMMEKARQLVQVGGPAIDRTHADHFKAVAEAEVKKIRAKHEEEAALAKEKEEARKRVGPLLGNYDPATDQFDGEARWVKEARRFSYVVNPKTGEFITRLKPVVDRINREMELAGFPGPTPLDKPGIHFDPNLGDVEIVLPRAVMKSFLAETDTLEQRMAEKLMISIEAVRLTDRDIVEGAVAARLNAVVSGVHDVNYGFTTRGYIRQLGVNSLLAVANQQLQVQQLSAVAAGAFPDGTPLVSIQAPTLPPLQRDISYTTIGSNFSIGSDPIFFDGREQTFGFAYVDPNGVKHTVGLDVVDSLRKFWGRIERNLIVHKIKKDPTIPPTKFTVPVGPATNTFDGLAALISQEDQNLIVATGTGAISQISAKAGTWLVIQDFQITPVPGSSMALSEEEQEDLRLRTMLTMLLRDPNTPVEHKREFLEAGSADQLRGLLTRRLEEKRNDRIRPGPEAPTYGAVFEERYAFVLDDAIIKKKEENTVIALTFYSSQGSIIQSPGATQLGSANDLTSLTTELRPNVVTPISSFVLKNLENTDSKSPMTGLDKGQSQNESSTMAHLLVRTRFPTAERERRDLEEGRQIGYFKLPLEREPLSPVKLPFLSSSEHPLERLASFRVGAMFDSLQASKIRRDFNLFEPNMVQGTISEGTWKAATTRLLLNAKIITDSPNNDPALVSRFRQRFILEVRSLLEYDPDFFDAPSVALRNMAEWNDADRIVLVLNNSPGRFALERLLKMVDELGVILVPDEYAADYLARSDYHLFEGHRLTYLTEDELRDVRRDVANHFLRCGEAYGDAFLEAVSNILGLGSYRAMKKSDIQKGPLRGGRDLVVFDRGGGVATEESEGAHEEFLTLKKGGIKGGMFERSLVAVEDMKKENRRFVVHGDDILP